LHYSRCTIRRTTFSLLKLIFTALLCCFALSTGGVKASGQTITGAVRGIVTDPTGAVVNGVRITVSNVATGVSNNTFSDPSGLYNFQFLPIGTYTITAAASGFDTCASPKCAMNGAEKRS
jgi:hypothetical protein